ncbi:4-hydroxyphenylpyruvate dioxygenase-like [Papaver somniferum]|nr:4-hydroxyphenylpyruvate dioxygenase-like [Papaver somniferum]
MENDMQKQQHNNHGGDGSFKLVGHGNFTRTNPRSDKFHVKKFHHVEFWCSDAINVAQRFSYGLGIPITEKSDLSTGNMVHASYLLHSGDLNILFTAPYSPSVAEILTRTTCTTASVHTFNHSMARSFSTSHGLGVRAIAVEVEDAESAFNISISCGARSSHPPMEINDGIIISEIELYGDVVLRYISFKNSNLGLNFLPGFKGINDEEPTLASKDLEDFGIRRLDHVAGNVMNLPEVVKYVKMFSGFHEFSQFTIDDLTGVIESGLNSAVLANNGESVLLNITEPVYGTKTKSQIQTYLEHNQGEGVGHMAFASEDIFTTLKEMKKRSRHGFEFMPPPPTTYYKTLKHRIGDNVLKDEQIKECEELGILVDKDDQGVVFQIFAKPVSDRPTILVEIIHRIGCMVQDEEGNIVQKGGCGGFGRGNISALFKSVEEYEKNDIYPNSE